MCVAGTCELCKEHSHCTALFPGDGDKKACFQNGCRQCHPDTQETDCLVTGFKTCTNGYCKSADGNFPDVAPDGTKATYRKPWTKNTFQSKVLAPLQKTGEAITAISTDGASVAKVFGDARRDYIELLNAVTLSLDGMAGINQANNLALRDKAFDNELWRHDKAASWLDFLVDLINKLATIEEAADKEEERHKNLIQALIGKDKGDSMNNLKKVLEDFTSKLTKKFKNIDTWATGVGTWAGEVIGHVHPETQATTGVATPPIKPLNPLMKVTRTLQPINNNTSRRSLTGPLGDGNPITADDTRVTLDWLNNILPTLNLTKEEEEVVEMLGSEPKFLIEVLTRARQGELKNENVDQILKMNFQRPTVLLT